MKRYLAALILLISGYLSATTVTGTIQDINGNRYSNGTVSAFSVITGASMTPAATDANGTFSITLTPSTYTFTVCAKPVNIGPSTSTSVTQVCAQPATPIVISGGSQDVSTQINAVAPILGPSVTALLGANNAFTGNNTFSGLSVFTGSILAHNINGKLFASTYCFGSTDLGVCINNTVASSTVPQTVVIDAAAPTTILTSPNLLLGWNLEAVPNTFTLATTWNIRHRGTNYEFNKSQFNYTQDLGNAAFLIGKNIVSVVNTNGTAITWVSGTQFCDIDTGDQVFINGGTANVGTPAPTCTSLTILSSAGVQNGVGLEGYMTTTTALGSYYDSISIHNLTVNYAGAGLAANIGVWLDAITDPYLDNVYVGNFGAFGNKLGIGFLGTGLQLGQFVNIKSNVNHIGIELDHAVHAGVEVSSNVSQFYSPTIQASSGAAATTFAILLQNNSFGNSFHGCDIEGTQGTISVLIQTGARKTLFDQGCDFERNGDGTAGSMDISILAPGTTIKDSTFQSSQANRPATGIIASTGAINTRLENNWWNNGQYATAYNFINGATGVAINNYSDSGSVVFGQPLTVISPTQITGVALNFTGVGWAAGAFHTGANNGSFTYANGSGNGINFASAANNLVVPFVDLDGSNIFQINRGGVGSGIQFNNIFAGIYASSFTNEATSGAIRLTNLDAIAWRNNANGANIPLTKTGAASGSVPADTLDISAFGALKSTSILTSGTIQNATGTAIMGLTLKKGSGAGNYTNATTTYTVADSTNLCFTVTIPTGWKLGVSASGYLSTATAAVVAQAALTDNAACSTANAGILTETAPIQGAAIGVADSFALDWVITGDGAAHNIAMQFKTSNVADTASLINSSATVTPTMKFELMPSN